MSAAIIERYRLLSTAVEIRARTSWYPDNDPPDPPRLDFVARLEFFSISTLSAAGADVIEVSEADYRALIDLGDAAIDRGGGDSGADTAIGRDITSLELERYQHDREGPPQLAVYRFNHNCPTPRDRPSWRRLFERLRAHGALPGVIDPIIGWFSPQA